MESVLSFFKHLLGTDGFYPRDMCRVNWPGYLILLHNVSDLAIWGAYLAIPVVLFYFVYRRKEPLPFRHIFWLFGIFILSCGLTHFMEFYTYSTPMYRLSGLIKLVTAVSSWGTVIALIPITPLALAMRSSEALEDDLKERTKELEDQRAALAVSNDALQREVADRQGAQNHLQTQLERLNLLSTITRAIGERQDIGSIYQVVIQSIEENLPIDLCCICSSDPSGDHLFVDKIGTRSTALCTQLGLVENATIRVDPDGVSRCIHGQLVYEPDLSATDFPFPKRLNAGGLRSLVCAPLLVESRVFGILVTARMQPGGFSSGDCEFLQQLSQHVALAAHQAELHSSLVQAYDDLTRTQQAVMQQERLRALGEMASGIAHDINNAISPISLYTEALLEREENLSDRGREQLNTIARAIDDVAATVARLREFYRNREPQLTPLPVSLNGLVQEVLDLTRARWSDMPLKGGIVISAKPELEPELPAIMAVESEIRELLTNLVFNAVDAMPEGGTLTIRTMSLERPALSNGASKVKHVLVEVSDTGIGMDEETRRRCLEPFFTTKGERGTGLGLAMVYGAVQRHGAKIEIESTPANGTTVTIDFDVRSSAASPEKPSAFEHPAGSRHTILVVDDDPLLLRSLRDTLEADGHLVVTANGGSSGIETFEASAKSNGYFPVVITDLGMPGVDGRKVAASVKQLSPSTLVILLTGWGQRLVSEGEVPPYVDVVLNKPPKLRDLREALARVHASAEGS